MTKILHASDLHLSSDDEKGYGFSVLREIIEKANEHDARYLLLSGDTFNSFSDLEKLRSDFRNALNECKSRIFCITGNHENLRKPENKSVSTFDFSPARFISENSFEYIKEGDIEFIFFPFREDMSDWRGWDIPPRPDGIFRIAMAHGIIPLKKLFFGPDNEGNASIIDPAMFIRFGIQYAAMGHIHARIAETQGDLRISYPGSARVWRSGEMGERFASLLEFSNGRFLKEESLPLKSAGQFRECEIPLLPDLNKPNLDRLSSGWSNHDRISLRFSGIVDNETKAESFAREIKQGLETLGFRKVDIEWKPEEDLIVLREMPDSPVIRGFLKKWEEMGNDMSGEQEKDDWFRAREIALRIMTGGK